MGKGYASPGDAGATSTFTKPYADNRPRKKRHSPARRGGGARRRGASGRRYEPWWCMRCRHRGSKDGVVAFVILNRALPIRLELCCAMDGPPSADSGLRRRTRQGRFVGQQRAFRTVVFDGNKTFAFPVSQRPRSRIFLATARTTSWRSKTDAIHCKRTVIIAYSDRTTTKVSAEEGKTRT